MAEIKEEPERDGNNTLVRAKLACEACRANKVRCIRETSPGQCVRCFRFGLQCSDPVIQKKRGRPPKSADRQGPPESAGPRRRSSISPPPSSGRQPSYEMQNPHNNGMYPPRDYHHLPQEPGPSTYHQQSHQHHDHTQHHNHTQPHSQAYNQYPISTPAFSHEPVLQHGQSTHSYPNYLAPSRSTQVGPPINVVDPSPDSMAASTPRSGQNNLDLSGYLDPTDKVEPKLPFFHNNPAVVKGQPAEDDSVGLGRTSDGEDPVSLSMLSAVEAHALVQLFHERLNPHVAVLDHQLHTLKYLRRTSTVLFCSVLAASSRFFRKDLHRRLLSHSQTVLDRAVTAGASDIGMVQSLMILTYWKNPSDTSAWRKIGMAIRIGYQSLWHIPRRDPLPEDEAAARQLLNAERTWHCLFCFDRGLSQTFGLPVAIRINEISDPEIWAREHLHLGPSVDMHLAASSELCKLKDHWKSIFETGAPSPAYVESSIDTMINQCEALMVRFFTINSNPPNFEQDKEHVIKWCILDFIHILHRHRLELAPHDALRLDMCLATATKCVDEIDILADQGPLPIMQDTGSCMTSALIVFLSKIFRDCTRSQKTLIVSLLQRILLSHSRVSEDDDDMATAYVARFTRRILGAVGQASRAASPGMIDTMGSSEDGMGFMAELEQFLQMPDNVVQNETKDQEYWSMLFAADPTNNFAPMPNASFPGF